MCSDCGLYTCVFTELIYDGYDYVEIGSKTFNPVFCRLRYGALLWDYANKKIDAGAISENEFTGMVVSKLSGPVSDRVHVGENKNVTASKYVPRRKC